MLETLFSILFVYLFILLGFLAKKIFKEGFDTKTLTLMSVYFLQPFVSVWGFSSAPLAFTHLKLFGFYFFIVALLLIPTLLVARVLFNDPKSRSIAGIAGFVGNTGNIGIPLGIALFGEQSIIYTTIINLANVFVVYILGAYIYSRGSFDIKQSLLNVLKIPIIPASLIAIALNLTGATLPYHIKELFTMGAYSGIVLQLFLLGSFLATVHRGILDKKLFAWVLTHKFIFLPLATALTVSFTHFSPLVKAIIIMQMITPLAVANINLASLYACKPKSVAMLIALSTLLFIPILFVFKALIRALM